MLAIKLSLILNLNSEQSDVTNLNYSKQILHNCSFKGQDLSGADFSGSDLRGCDFTRATLIGANFQQVKTGQSQRQVSMLVASAIVSPVFLFGSSIIFAHLLSVLLSDRAIKFLFGAMPNDKAKLLLILLVE
jgi:uncharacterized protein YjbI with pentapeptide repeats